MTTLFCWSGASTLAKPIFLPTPRVAFPRTHFFVVLPRFVRMKVAFVPRGAEFGCTLIAPSVMVTLTVRIAGEFVVQGWARAGAATESETRNARAMSLRLLMARILAQAQGRSARVL